MTIMKTYQNNKKKTKHFKNKITRRKLNDMQGWAPKEERKKRKNIWKLDFLKIDNSTNLKNVYLFEDMIQEDISEIKQICI